MAGKTQQCTALRPPFLAKETTDWFDPQHQQLFNTTVRRRGHHSWDNVHPSCDRYVPSSLVDPYSLQRGQFKSLDQYRFLLLEGGSGAYLRSSLRSIAWSVSSAALRNVPVPRLQLSTGALRSFPLKMRITG